MASESKDAGSEDWLLDKGPGELESLLRAVIYHSSTPILVADDDRNCRDVSVGASKLLGAPRDQIVGRKLDDFAAPDFESALCKLWSSFLGQGEQDGTLLLSAPDGTVRDVAYTARASVLPMRNLLLLGENAATLEAQRGDQVKQDDTARAVRDYALFLLDVRGRIAEWYRGAARVFGYTASEASGQHVSVLYDRDENAGPESDHELSRAAGEGHFGNEVWNIRKDGSRLWANVITTALRDEAGELRGFARIVRDFTDRRESDERLRRSRTRDRIAQAESTIAGIVSGEFDYIPEANDAFLNLVGYSREDITAGQLNWPDLSPPEFAALDDLAHEEGLKYGACTPYEKELIHKSGDHVPVLVATAVLKLSPFRWISFIQHLDQRHELETNSNENAPDKQAFLEMVGTSTALKRILRQVEVVAPTDANVLILGETGTGKELVARAIHRLSSRRERPFITLNCAAIPTGLLESELFGYERGAFTGALAQKIGRFEMAHRGTLFLDEVGDIPLDLQPKLLRALQEKSFERLGGTKTIPIDVRLVAATNRNLTQMMGDKLFRSDLYYRLKVFPITTPPLRDRPDDIPLLVRHFTRKYADEMKKQISTIPPDTMRSLVSWSWPGNIRELENFIERSVILSQGSSLRAPISEIQSDTASTPGPWTLEHVEREHVLMVLRETGGVVSKAAARLGMPRTTLNALMTKLGVSRKDILR